MTSALADTKHPQCHQMAEFSVIIVSAAMQVSFEPSSAGAGPNIFEVQLAGLKLRVFTHSFLGFGQDTAQALAASASVSQDVNLTAGDGSAQVVDPCLPTGYAANEVVGGGNFGLCRAIAAGLLARTCNDTNCPFGEILPLEGGLPVSQCEMPVPQA